MNTKTQVIAGHRITLETGHNYIASRPIAERGRKVYPITITKRDADRDEPVMIVSDSFTYDEANEFLTEFNNGAISFDGRDW